METTIDEDKMEFLTNYVSQPFTISTDTIKPILNEVMKPNAPLSFVAGREIAIRAMYGIKLWNDRWSLVLGCQPAYTQYMPVINPHIRSIWKQQKIAPIQRIIRKMQYR